MAGITINHENLSCWDLAQFPKLMALRDKYFAAVPEMCIERPRLITQYHLQNGLFDKNKISILDKAKTYRYVLENRLPIVWHEKAMGRHDVGTDRFDVNDTSPFAGSTTSKFKGVLLYPELFGLVMWPELNTVSTRPSNPFYISKKDGEELNFKVYPPWMKKTVWEITRYRHYCNQFQEPITDDYPDEMKLFQNVVFFLTSKAICISHCIPDFSMVLKVGLSGMILDAKEKKISSENDEEVRQYEFYSAVVEVLEGIISYSKRLADEAARLVALSNDTETKDKLSEIVNRYRKIPESKPDTFLEAVTAIWICWTALHLENANIGLSLGRLDQLLYPFYEKDVASLCKQKRTEYDKCALELLCYLWLKIGDHVPTMLEAGEQLFGGTGSNQAVTIGGVDENGEDAVNDVTYLILRAAELMRLRDPNLAARYHPDKNSKTYLKRLSEVNIHTGAIPAIHNDKAVIKALMSKGDSEEQARDYGIVGCVEPVSSGRTFGHNAAIILNLASALELALYDGKHRHTGPKQISPKTGDPTTFGSFRDFWLAFQEQTKWLINRATTLNDQLGRTHQEFYPTPVLSAFFKGPMDKGMDVLQGGAEINSSGAAIIGLADVVDSLSAIKKWIYDEKRIPFSRLLEALEAVFKGFSDIFGLLENTNKTPKFGNDDNYADSIAIEVVSFLDKEFYARKNYRGANYRVGYWTMTFHAGIGKFTGALPNGRRSQANFASGITPVSNVTHYLSKTLNSLAKLPSQALSSGAALNIKYTPEPDPKIMCDHFAATVDAFFGKGEDTNHGGIQIQFNVTSQDTFLEAMNHPEKYFDLPVRVSGYTAYFVDLNRQMQKEIMERTEYLLSPGQAQPSAPVDIPS